MTSGLETPQKTALDFLLENIEEECLGESPWIRRRVQEVRRLGEEDGPAAWALREDFLRLVNQRMDYMQLCFRVTRVAGEVAGLRALGGDDNVEQTAVEKLLLPEFFAELEGPRDDEFGRELRRRFEEAQEVLEALQSARANLLLDEMDEHHGMSTVPNGVLRGLRTDVTRQESGLLHELLRRINGSRPESRRQQRRRAPRPLRLKAEIGTERISRLDTALKVARKESVENNNWVVSRAAELRAAGEEDGAAAEEFYWELRRLIAQRRAYVWLCMAAAHVASEASALVSLVSSTRHEMAELAASITVPPFDINGAPRPSGFLAEIESLRTRVRRVHKKVRGRQAQVFAAYLLREAEHGRPICELPNLILRRLNEEMRGAPAHAPPDDA